MTASKTTMRYGDPNAMIQQAAGLFALCQGRNSTLNRLTGKMPSGTSDAEKKTKGQSSLELPIVRPRTWAATRATRCVSTSCSRRTPSRSWVASTPRARALA